MHGQRRFRQTLRQMCIAQFILVQRTSSYEEDDAPNVLYFLKEATLLLEANDDIEDQGQEAETTSPLYIMKSTAY